MTTPQNYAATPAGVRHLECGAEHWPGHPCPAAGRQLRRRVVGDRTVEGLAEVVSLAERRDGRA